MPVGVVFIIDVVCGDR